MRLRERQCTGLVARIFSLFVRLQHDRPPRVRHKGLAGNDREGGAQEIQIGRRLRGREVGRRDVVKIAGDGIVVDKEKTAVTQRGEPPQMIDVALHIIIEKQHKLVSVSIERLIEIHPPWQDDVDVV